MKKNSEELVIKALELHEQQQYAEAFALFNEAAKEKHPRAQNAVGLYYALGLLAAPDYNQAEKYFKQSIAQNYPDAYKNLANIYATDDFDKPEEAVNLYDTYIKLNPDDPDIYDTVYWIIIDKLNDPHRAKIFLKRAVQKFPEDPDFYFHLGYTSELLEEVNEAFQYYEKSIQLYGDDLTDDYNHQMAFNNLGLLYYANQEDEKAQYLFNKLFEFNPEHEQALYNLGCLNQANSRFNEAREFYHKFLKINPDNLSALCNIGTTYFFEENYPEAIKAFQQVLILDDTNREAHNGMADCLDKLGRSEEAKLCRLKVMQLSVPGLDE